MDKTRSTCEQLVDTQTAARHLGMAVVTLRLWTSQKKIPHYRLGRAVRYRLSDLEEWLNTRLVKSE